MVATRTPPARPPEDSAPKPAHRHHLPSRGTVAFAALVTLSVVAFLLTTGGGGGGSGVGGGDPLRDVYTIRTGDTISFVAELHAVSEDALMEENDLTRSDSLGSGDQLLIPQPPTEGREPPPELQSHPTKPELEPVFDRWAAEYDVPPALVKALAWDQSAWTAAAGDTATDEEDEEEVGDEEEDSGSDEGIGIGRLAPETARFVNDAILGGAGLNPADPEDGIQLMAAYLGFLLEENDRSWAATVSSYRGGLQGPREGAWDLNRVGQITEVLEVVPDFEVSLASLGIDSATTTTEES